MVRFDEGKLEQVLELLKGAADKGMFPGACAAVGSSEGLHKTFCCGSSSLLPEVRPLTADTLYDLASLTKVVATTMLFMVFEQKGLLSVFDRVRDHLGMFSGEDKDDTLLLHLLTHTSGLPPYLQLYRLCHSSEQVAEYICSTPLACKPGSKVIYSDLGFILLGKVLEIAGGARLDELCAKYVFKPLGMLSTGYRPKGGNIAATEIDEDTGLPLCGVCHDSNARFMDGISGHAGAFSNIYDLAVMARMLINGGRHEGGTFISPAAFRAMTTSYTAGLDEDRGIGWCIRGSKWEKLPSWSVSGGDFMSPSAFGHTGFTGTSMWVDIENDVFVVLLTNRVHPTRENTSMLGFRRLFHNAVLGSLNNT